MPQTKPSLLRYITAYKTRGIVGFFCVIFYIAGSLSWPKLQQLVIDGLSYLNPPLEAASAAEVQEWLTRTPLTEARLYQLCAAVLAVGVFTGVFAIFMRRLLIGLGYRAEYDIRCDVFAHLSRLDLAFFQRERTGDIMTKMSSDLGAVREMIGQGWLQGSRIAAGFPFAFAVMYHTDPKLTGIVALILPFVSLIFFVSIRLIHTAYDRAQDQFSAIANFSQETFAGFRTIKGFGIESRQRGRFKQLNDEYIKRSLKLSRIEEPLWPFMMLLYIIGQVFLLLIGGRQVIRGEITLGTFWQFQLYFAFLQWPMLSLGFTTNLFQRGRTSWKRLRTILDVEPAVRDPESFSRSAGALPENLRGDIEFRGVTLRGGERTLLDQIDLKIPAGQRLAITGPTGGGKTLLASLLVRLTDPTEGAVKIGGRDVREYPLEILRRRIGIAPQEPFLFSDSLANNLALGLEPVDDALKKHEEKILWAADIANLRRDVETFPMKFSTMLGERGVTLSGGQRQRTAIGRALARQPDILILDDVFSAVDTQTEERILQQLLPVLRGRTSIIISHRVSTLRHADRILVIENGRISQDGSHAGLTAQPGYYQELDEVQRLEARLEENGTGTSNHWKNAAPQLPIIGNVEAENA